MSKKPWAKNIAISVTAGALILGVLLFKSFGLNRTTSLRPYFSYSAEELKSLDELDTDKTITEEEVNNWVQVAFDLVKKTKKEIDFNRIYAYLFTAHRDAAALSHKSKNRLAGNLTEVSKKTICLLLPDDCSQIPLNAASDPYSSKLAEIVFSKIKSRLEEEEAMIASNPLKSPPSNWSKDKHYFGRNFPNQKPWLLGTNNQFRPEAPSAYTSTNIKIQIQELRNILSSVTKEQLDSAKKWEEGRGTITTGGQWIAMANQYMTEHKIPLETALFIRSVLAMALSDATNAYSDSKYTYWKKRPKAQFPDLQTPLKTPSSPSYPSGHSTLGAAGAIIMDHYFPENQAQWDKTGSEIGHSRLWGGVHFPIDDQDGVELGRKIGNWVVQKIETNKSN